MNSWVSFSSPTYSSANEKFASPWRHASLPRLLRHLLIVELWPIASLQLFGESETLRGDLIFGIRSSVEIKGERGMADREGYEKRKTHTKMEDRKQKSSYSSRCGKIKDKKRKPLWQVYDDEMTCGNSFWRGVKWNVCSFNFYFHSKWTGK